MKLTVLLLHSLNIHRKAATVFYAFSCSAVPCVLPGLPLGNVTHVC